MGFFGKAQMPPQTGWEPFEMASDADDYCAGDWAKIIRRAASMGVKVEFSSKGIVMSHGKSEGLFKDYKGGVSLAKRFLEEIA